MAQRTELALPSLVLARPFDRRLLEIVTTSVQSGISRASKIAYSSDWERFKAFCVEHGVPSLPADEQTIALHLADLKMNGCKFSTLSRAVCGIRHHHAQADQRLGPLPVIGRMLSGLAREMDLEPHQKKPLLPEHLFKIAAGMSRESLLDSRDLAVLMVGWGGGLRRSEIVSLDVNLVEFSEKGMDLRLDKTKSSQRKAVRVAIPKQASSICPVRVLRHWLDFAALKEGPIFLRLEPGDKVKRGPWGGRLSSQGVRRIVRDRVKQIGLNPDEYGGHSPRAGMVTSAANAGVPIADIMKSSRHKSVSIALRYVRNSERFERAAIGGLLEQIEQPGLREKAIALHKERGASPEVIAKAFAKVGVDVSVATIAGWVR
jgi:site-specific recombinase XerD